MKKTFKNKVLCVVFCFLLAFVFCACDGGDVVETGKPAGVSDDAVSMPEVSQKPESVESIIEEKIEIHYPLEMYFSSGVGGWYTVITINADGSFFGEYIDSEAENASDYPNGSVYISKFTGQFSKLIKVNDYTFALTVENIEIEGEVGQSYIEDGIRYIVSNPNGLMNNDDSDFAMDYLLYTPDAPVLNLNEDFLSWWPNRTQALKPETLELYGLFNTKTQVGFFTLPSE